MLDKAKKISELLYQSGARDCLMVGGYVRDRLMGIDSKDIDLEVYGLDYDEIVAALQDHFQVDLVGKSFGIVKIDNAIDVGIPRRENKQGIGHKGFDVKPDPGMSYKEAALRRDFTINSIALSFDDRIIDPYDGQGDIEKGILRATSPAFKEDPLRVLRGMQFAARLGFRMDADTIAMCREVSIEFPTLSKERIWEEWQKWTKGAYPSRGLTVLQETGWLAQFPELAALPETPQEPQWHPEGDVFLHTGYVCDAAADIAQRENFTVKERTVLLFAALLHDAGKAETTEKGTEGRWVSPGHAEAGVKLAVNFFKSIKAPGWVVELVKPLVAEHMAHMSLPADEPPSDRAVRRLANRLSPANIRLWAALCEADASGRPPLPKNNPVSHWQAVAERLTLERSKPAAILMGRHLMDNGIKPGPHMGAILKSAYEAQLDGRFHDLNGALQWLAEHSGTD